MSENPDRRSHFHRKDTTSEYVARDRAGKSLSVSDMGFFFLPLTEGGGGRRGVFSFMSRWLVSPLCELMLLLYPRQQDGV